MPCMIGGTLHHQQLEKARATTAGDLMTAPPVPVSPQDTVEDAAMADVALSTSSADAIEVAVQDGIVALSGKAQTCEIARDIARRLRHIEGAVAVRDQLSYPLPGPASFDVVASFPSGSAGAGGGRNEKTDRPYSGRYSGTSRKTWSSAISAATVTGFAESTWHASTSGPNLPC
jgi:hypothetical protein